VEKRRDLEATADEIEQLFDDLWQVFPFTRGARHGYRPDADCFRTEDPPAFTVLVELPGVDPEHVKLVAAPRVLIVAGERRRPQDRGQYQQMEIEYGPFQRKVALSEDIDPDAATATYNRGILRVTLPIAPKPAPRASVTIEVRTSR
jgi:HSP20 family molecular chaperone IbpA